MFRLFLDSFRLFKNLSNSFKVSDSFWLVRILVSINRLFLRNYSAYTKHNKWTELFSFWHLFYHHKILLCIENTFRFFWLFQTLLDSLNTPNTKYKIIFKNRVNIYKIYQMDGAFLLLTLFLITDRYHCIKDSFKKF